MKGVAKQEQQEGEEHEEHAEDPRQAGAANKRKTNCDVDNMLQQQ